MQKPCTARNDGENSFLVNVCKNPDMLIIHNEIIIYSGAIINTGMVLKRANGVPKEQVCVTMDKDVLEWIDERSEDCSRSKEINILLREVMEIKKKREAKAHGRCEVSTVELVAQTG